MHAGVNHENVTEQMSGVPNTDRRSVTCRACISLHKQLGSNIMPTNDGSGLEGVARLTRDLRDAAIKLSRKEARYLVDTYYQIQNSRIRANNQVRSLTESGEPHVTLSWLFNQNEVLEGQIVRALQSYAESQPLGQWALSITGIGPVIAAGLLAHIDIENCEVATRIWRFAGLDPSVSWNKGEKRPWNAKLKTLCWKIGESFVKQQSRESDVYGKMFKVKKETLIGANERGDYAEQAAGVLAKRKFNKSTQAYKWYSGEWVFYKQLNPHFDAMFSHVKLSTAKVEAEPERDGMGARVDGAGEMREEEATVSGKMVAVADRDPNLIRPMLPPAHIHARARRWVVKMFLSHYHEQGYRIVRGKEPPRPYVFAILGHADQVPCPNKDVGLPEGWKAVA